MLRGRNVMLGQPSKRDHRCGEISDGNHIADAHRQLAMVRDRVGFCGLGTRGVQASFWRCDYVLMEAEYEDVGTR